MRTTFFVHAACFHLQSREQIKMRLWNDHFVEYGRTVCMFRTEKIRKLVAMGIPESLRGKLWLLFSGERFWGLQADFYFWSRHGTKAPTWAVCVCRRVPSACDVSDQGPRTFPCWP